MSDERRVPSKHKLVVDQRENVAVTGVLDVISFDEEQVICDTDLGVLIMRGENLHVNNLNLASGSLDIFGEITSITYDAQAKVSGGGRQKSSLFGKIFK